MYFLKQVIFIDVEQFEVCGTNNFVHTEQIATIEPEDILEIIDRHNFGCSSSQNALNEFQYLRKRLVKLPDVEKDFHVLGIQLYFDEFISFATVQEKTSSSCFIIKNFAPEEWKKFRNIHLICNFFLNHYNIMFDTFTIIFRSI